MSRKYGGGGRVAVDDYRVVAKLVNKPPLCFGSRSHRTFLGLQRGFAEIRKMPKNVLARVLTQYNTEPLAFYAF